MPAPTVTGLFESHLPVRDLDRSVAFYRDVVELELGLHDGDLGAAFFWVEQRRSMLGLWASGPAPLGISLHVAFSASLDEVLSAPGRLRELGLTPLSFYGDETDEPSVIGWLPAAAVYFRDPDGHLLEYLSVLDTPPDPGRGVLPWSSWGTRR
jgi:lactoylglutathione lyase